MKLIEEAKEILKFLSDRMKTVEKRDLLESLGVESVQELLSQDLSEKIERLRLEKRRRMRVTDCTFTIEPNEKESKKKEPSRETQIRATQTFVDRSIPEHDR